MVSQRLITMAREVIDLPIATDHNVPIDHRPYAQWLGLQDGFTAVIRNEITLGGLTSC